MQSYLFKYYLVIKTPGVFLFFIYFFTLYRNSRHISDNDLLTTRWVEIVDRRIFIIITLLLL
jgi:hypothetical protein